MYSASEGVKSILKVSCCRFPVAICIGKAEEQVRHLCRFVRVVQYRAQVTLHLRQKLVSHEPLLEQPGGTDAGRQAEALSKIVDDCLHSSAIIIYCLVAQVKRVLRCRSDQMVALGEVDGHRPLS